MAGQQNRPGVCGKPWSASRRYVWISHRGRTTLRLATVRFECRRKGERHSAGSGNRLQCHCASARCSTLQQVQNEAGKDRGLAGVDLAGYYLLSSAFLSPSFTLRCVRCPTGRSSRSPVFSSACFRSPSGSVSQAGHRPFRSWQPALFSCSPGPVRLEQTAEAWPGCPGLVEVSGNLIL